MKLPASLDHLTTWRLHDRATWTVYARRLREAGHLPPSKRGRGSEHISAEGLASLVLGAFGTGSPVKAPEVVSALRAMPRIGPLEYPEGLPTLRRAMEAVTFGAAIDTLIGEGDQICAELRAARPREVRFSVSIKDPGGYGLLDVLESGDGRQGRRIFDAIWAGPRYSLPGVGWHRDTVLSDDNIFELAGMVLDRPVQLWTDEELREDAA